MRYIATKSERWLLVLVCWVAHRYIIQLLLSLLAYLKCLVRAISRHFWRLLKHVLFNARRFGFGLRLLRLIAFRTIRISIKNVVLSTCSLLRCTGSKLLSWHLNVLGIWRNIKFCAVIVTNLSNAVADRRTFWNYEIKPTSLLHIKNTHWLSVTL